MKGRDVLFSHKSDDHGTPQWLYDKLDKEYKFELDPCCDAKNQKAPYGFGLDGEFIYKNEYRKMHFRRNGLLTDWGEFKHVFVNPPYSEIDKWVEKGIDSLNNRTKLKTVVYLLPSRTDRPWFTQKLLPLYKRIIFIEGRLKFEGQTNYAPFPSMIVELSSYTLDHRIEVWSNKP